MLKKLQNYQNLIIFLIAIVIFLSPFVVNYSDLPKGYELAKVHFLNFSSLIIIAIFLIGVISGKLRLQSRRIRNTLLTVFLLLGIYLISTIVSSYRETAILGNSFREQGIVFYSLITIIAAVTFLCINKFNQIFLIWALFISATIQAVLGISQYLRLLQTRPEIADDGYWVNGTFGQANFYSTLLVVGFISGVFLLNYLYIMKSKAKFPMLALTLLSLILIVIANIFSYSIFGWVTMIVSMILLLLYKVLNKNLFYKIFIFSISFTAIASIFAITKIENNLRIEIWEASITQFIRQLTANPLHFLFGFGFDTLGKVFKEGGFFAGATVDRGHNIFVDIFMQVGVIGLGLCVFLIITILRKIKEISHDSSLFILFLLVFIFALKTFIHEFSAIQTYLIFLLVAALIGRINPQPESKDLKKISTP